MRCGEPPAPRAAIRGEEFERKAHGLALY
jgi:hypothetical protein